MSSFAIETRNLIKRFGTYTAVDGLNIQIRKGVIYGFLGPNGCGKTTTLRMLCGLLAPSTGEVLLMGTPVEHFSVAMRTTIGYMSQRFSLYNELSGYENLRFYAGMYGLEGAEQRRRIGEMLELTQLEEFKDKPAGTLSGGWRQRLALAAAIMHRPKILFLDEPTSGVDPISSRLFWDIVYALAADGVSVVASTHSMNEAEHCDEVGFLHAGRLIRSGTPQSLKAAFPGRIIAIRSDDTIALSHALQKRFLSGIESYIYGNEVRIHIKEGGESAFENYDYREVEPSLEDLFVYLSEHGDVAAS